MRKLVIFLLLTLGWVTVSGQTGRPCAVYDQNRDISGMKEILMMDGTFYINLRISYAEAINYSIGKNVVTASKYGMETILENTVLLDVDFIVPDDYLNGARFGDKVTFTTLTGQPSDKWAAFRYEGVDHVYAKVSCMNPQRIKKMGSLLKIKPESIPQNLSSIKTDDNWVYAPPKKVYGNEVPDLFYFPTKEKKFKWKPVIIVGGVVVGLGGIGYGIYSLITNHNHHHGGPGSYPPTNPDPPTEDDGEPGGRPPTTGK